MDEKKLHNFYGTSSPFSNFHLAQIKLENFLDGKKLLSWPTTEHYYQAQKFPSNKEYMELIRSALTPALAKKYGSNKKMKMRHDWDQVKEDVMYKALKAKFTQNLKLKEELMLTKDLILVEHTPRDHYWGDGGKYGLGKNRLGELLMKLRNEHKVDDVDVKISK